MNGVNTADTFESVLSLVRQQRDDVDLLVLTGIYAMNLPSKIMTVYLQP